MTNEQVKSAFLSIMHKINERSAYRLLEPKQIGERLSSMCGFTLSNAEMAAHLKFMCDEGQKFVDEDRMEKAMRWLGFVQCAAWMLGFYTLDELKNQSRSDTNEQKQGLNESCEVHIGSGAKAICPKCGHETSLIRLYPHTREVVCGGCRHVFNIEIQVSVISPPRETGSENPR